jgi:GTP-binding protein HflX
LLLHVADASNPAVRDQIGAAFRVLQEIGIDEKSQLLVLNKTDAVDSPARIDGVRSRYPNALAISAVEGEGLDRLAAAVSDALSRTFRDIDVETRA